MDCRLHKRGPHATRLAPRSMHINNPLTALASQPAARIPCCHQQSTDHHYHRPSIVEQTSLVQRCHRPGMQLLPGSEAPVLVVYPFPHHECAHHRREASANALPQKAQDAGSAHTSPRLRYLLKSAHKEAWEPWLRARTTERRHLLWRTKSRGWDSENDDPAREAGATTLPASFPTLRWGRYDCADERATLCGGGRPPAVTLVRELLPSAAWCDSATEIVRPTPLPVEVWTLEGPARELAAPRADSAPIPLASNRGCTSPLLSAGAPLERSSRAETAPVPPGAANGASTLRKRGRLRSGAPGSSASPDVPRRWDTEGTDAELWRCKCLLEGKEPATLPAPVRAPTLFRNLTAAPVAQEEPSDDRRALPDIDETATLAPPSASGLCEARAAAERKREPVSLKLSRSSPFSRACAACDCGDDDTTLSPRMARCRRIRRACCPRTAASRSRNLHIARNLARSAATARDF